MAVLQAEEIALVKKAGAILHECLDVLSGEIAEGVTTKMLERKADEVIARLGAAPAFRGYRGFPASICTSRNSVVVHGMPSDTEILREGDIISIDVGAACGGCFADAARTFKVGKVSSEAERLIEVTKEALSRGIGAATSGNRVGDISRAIQSHVEKNKFTVVRTFVGHGIGRKIHESPEVPNFGPPHKGKVLEDGMALAIEPMVNAGTADVKILDDGWTAVTTDGRLSAHFEHTVIIDGKKAEIVT